MRFKTPDEKYAELRRRDYQLFRDCVQTSTVLVMNARLDERASSKIGAAIELAMIDFALRTLDRETTPA